MSNTHNVPTPRIRGLIIAVGTALAGAIIFGSAPPASAQTLNPFADAGGFSVYVRNDAVLNNSEVEGSLAVGGQLTTRASGGVFPIIHVAAGTGNYQIPVIDGDPTRLLVGSFSADSGLVQVKGTGGTDSPPTGYAKIVSATAPFIFAERGGYTQYRDGSDPNSAAEGAAIEGLNQPWKDNPNGETFLTKQSSVAAYVEQGPGFAATTSCLAALADPASTTAHHVSVTEDGGKAQLTLVEGMTNVVNYTDLLLGSGDTMASQITYAGVLPSMTTPLIVRVPAGTTKIYGATYGDSGITASYVMWDLSALSGAVAMGDAAGATGRVDGSIYGPEVDLTARFAPLDGQLITRNLTTPYGAGENHAYFFKPSITCENSASGSETTPSASQTTPSASQTTPSASQTTPSASQTTPSASQTSPSASLTSPSASLTSASASPSQTSPSPSAGASSTVKPTATSQATSTADGKSSAQDGGTGIGHLGGSADTQQLPTGSAQDGGTVIVLASTGASPMLGVLLLLGLAAVAIGSTLLLAHRRP